MGAIKANALFHVKASSRGITLIEVLVALLVLGIGIMGYAALQLKSVHLVEETYSRSQAMAIAQDFIERARANFSASAKAEYIKVDNWVTNSAPSPSTCTVTAGDAAAVEAGACSSSEMAKVDVYEARSHVAAMLADSAMSFDECNSIYCVTVAWNGSPATADTCLQDEVVGGERSANAHCIIVEFMP